MQGMATKTISIDLEAYERLRRARKSEKESFSQVIRRAEWRTNETACRDLLSVVESMEPLGEDVIEALERGQEEDRPPRSKWND